MLLIVFIRKVKLCIIYCLSVYYMIKNALYVLCITVNLAGHASAQVEINRTTTSTQDSTWNGFMNTIDVTKSNILRLWQQAL